MPSYRCYYLTYSGQRYGIQHFEAENDAAAIDYASKRLRSAWSKGHEVWYEQRLILREVYH